MGIEGRLRNGTVYAGHDARQRFYDARGYGRPLSAAEREAWGANGVALSRVEAAHLLARGDLDAVWADPGGSSGGSEEGECLGFRGFIARAGSRPPPEERGGFLVRFLVYADLRERGFYLSPAREGWPNADRAGEEVDFLVYPRGKGPGEGAIEHRARAVGERAPLPVADLSAPVVAVVDEESDVTYFDTERPDVSGTTGFDPPANLRGDLLADRAVLWDPPAELYRRDFLGRPLAGRDAGQALQLSLVEAAYLAACGGIDLGLDGDATDPPSLAGVDREGSDGDYRAVLARGRAVEGERFDRRLRAYAALRDRGVVPKTGFKFGADFRTYGEVESVDDLGHSELLVRVLPAGTAVSPRDLSLDVRLAHGVRKRMVFALVGDGDHSGDGPGDGDSGGGDPEIAWRSATRLTP
ncbi:tRNA-intron lyase [Halobacteriales archaeon QS_8_69_26]|nr:MAG: tRNA-intron lyase [Halobacteriales archaeon QS_8_69_26]